MFSAYTLLGMRASLFSLDTRNCVCMLSLNIDLPDHIPKVDARVLMYLAWGRGTFSNVLLIIMKDVEYEAKFAGIIKSNQVPQVEPRDVHHKGERGWAPDTRRRWYKAHSHITGQFSLPRNSL